jgi:hypothetical protein
MKTGMIPLTDEVRRGETWHHEGTAQGSEAGVQRPARQV